MESSQGQNEEEQDIKRSTGSLIIRDKLGLHYKFYPGAFLKILGPSGRRYMGVPIYTKIKAHIGN